MLTGLQDFVPYLAASLIGSGIAVLIYSIATKQITRALLPRVLGSGLIVLGVGLWTAFSLVPAKFHIETNKAIQQGSTEMTFTGRVRTDSGLAVFYPDPGQVITLPTLLIMRDIPLDGTAQQRLNAAVTVFADKVGPISIDGIVTPFANDHILVVFASKQGDAK